MKSRSDRFYRVPVDGDTLELPSVTTILQVVGKPALVNWSANMERELVTEAAADLYHDTRQTPEMGRLAFLTTLQSRIGKVRAHQRELEKAGDIGREAHALIEWHLRQSLGQKVGPEPAVSDPAQWAFMAFQDWARSVSLKPLLIEQKVWSVRWGYAGTMDLLAEVNGEQGREQALVDFKTGKAVYGEAHLQNAAYQVAVEEMGHGAPKRGIILRLPKKESDPEFEAVEVEDRDLQFRAFLSALDLWKWWYPREAAYRKRTQAAEPQKVAA